MIADWIHQHRQLQKIPSDQLDMIPTFVMLRRLMLKVWVAAHADADHAIAVTDGFADGTTRLAERYLSERDWLADVRETAFPVVSRPESRPPRLARREDPRRSRSQAWNDVAEAEGEWVFELGVGA